MLDGWGRTNYASQTARRGRSAHTNPQGLGRPKCNGQRGNRSPDTRVSVLQSKEYAATPDCPGVVVAALTQQRVVPSSLQLSGVWTQVWSQVPPSIPEAPGRG